MILLLLSLLLVSSQSYSFPTELTLPEHQTETRLRFAALDEVRLLANGLLQLGHSLKDFVQNTKNQINDISQKLNIFDKSFYQLSALASEIKEEEEELKKTTVFLKANNEEIKSMSLEINSKVEDIIKERNHLRSQVGGLEEKLSGLSQSLLSTEQVAEISTFKEIIQTQEKSITDLLKAVNEQSEQLNNQRTKIKGLENKLSIQETAENLRNRQTNSLSGYLPYITSDGSFSSDLPKDCGEVFNRGQKSSGLYAIKPHESKPFLVNCEFTEEGVFTVIQRRHDGSVDFDQSWEKYEDGFGDFSSEFWLGLKKIYAVARQGQSLLHVQIEDWGKQKHFIVYQYILEDAASNYTIHLKLQSAESSSAVDEHTGFRFSTKDHNDGNQHPNCTQDYTGGWWFSICGDINLNGKCIQSRPRKKGTHWKPGRGTTIFKASKISISHLTKPQTP
ncbi:angiopoietin-related protein 3-like [Rhinichthys klamathensis goyatoka]|uniref:angiopoietin-related protein 3-like n=1 Tax=Rhinichthys klamathensis goyatoka TaxID=3034132 RepID=UPI0024B51AF6|nr:angiopoietin-related protein 3-like [Rhinichthys klamathensis goyatoka]